MTSSFQLVVYDRQQEVHQEVFAGAVELGRQRDHQEALYASQRDGGRTRLVIAPQGEDTVSRDHALIEPLGGSRVRLTNTSAKVGIRLPDGVDLKAGGSCELTIPAVIVLGHKSVGIQGDQCNNGGAPLHGLAEATMPLGSPSGLARPPSRSLGGMLRESVRTSAQMEVVVRWLQAVVEVLHSATSSSDFFQKAALAAVDILGLERSHVLLYDGGEWKVVASCSSPRCDSSAGGPPSRGVLGRVLREKRTFWQDPREAELDTTRSLAGVRVVIGAPILGLQGEVIGALYGDSRREGLAAAPGAARLEAILVELLARGVAVGLARLEQERAAVVARVQFEQFFTPQLARQLAREPNLLEGRNAEVSLLFCDIRGFSRISERVGAEQTVRWVGEVMEALSDCVLRHSGVLVDYIGDELMAMWGAPAAQPEHARQACSAALEMLALLPALNERWQPVLKETFGVGFGISTGIARVGNTGSRHKFKYGPLGKAVTLASGVQCATKHLRCPLVVTEHTRCRISEPFQTRKLGRARVARTEQPIDLYELMPETHPRRQDLKSRYEAALEEFSDSHFRAATHTLGNLLADVPEDGPALVLLKRAVNALVDGPEKEHPIWDPPGK